MRLKSGPLKELCINLHIRTQKKTQIQAVLLLHPEVTAVTAPVNI